MAERSMGAAGFWPRRTVRVATRVLPDATRDRYRQEFLAELYGLGRARQLRHALGVLSRCWALRDAINTPSPAAAADMEIVFPRRRKRSLSCRLISALVGGPQLRRRQQPVAGMRAMRQGSQRLVAMGTHDLSRYAINGRVRCCVGNRGATA
jgi:hypothetical protein